MAECEYNIVSKILACVSCVSFRSLDDGLNGIPMVLFLNHKYGYLSHTLNDMSYGVRYDIIFICK